MQQKLATQAQVQVATDTLEKKKLERELEDLLQENHQLELDIICLKKDLQAANAEIDSLTNLRATNMSLEGERHDLIEKLNAIELQRDALKEQIKDQEATIWKKDCGLEVLKQKIVAITAIFEKKQVDSKYSPEILCDFILDKAKKVTSKLAVLTEENKVLQSEQSFYVKRKLGKLTDEIAKYKKSEESLCNVVLPKIRELLRVDASSSVTVESLVNQLEAKYRKYDSLQMQTTQRLRELKHDYETKSRQP